MRLAGRARRREHAEPTEDAAANEYVRLAAELRECMAFQPKKWRRVLEASSQLLHAVDGDRGGHANHEDAANVAAERVGRAFGSSVKSGEQRGVKVRAARPKSREEDEDCEEAGRVVLPDIYASNSRVPTLAQYLNQPQLVDEILREMHEPRGHCQKTEREHGLAVDFLQETRADLSEEDTRDQPNLRSLDAVNSRKMVRPAVLPVLSIVSPRTRDGLSRLPALTGDELRAVNELERLAEENSRRQSMYAALKHFGTERRTPNRGFRHRKMAAKESTERQAASVKVAKQLAFRSPYKKRGALSEMHLQRAEMILMALEDMDAVHLQVSPTSRFSHHQKNPPFVLPDGLPASTRLRLKRDREQLMEVRHATYVSEEAAEMQLDQTIQEIKRWIPLEVMYEFGLGKFASPGQQRAANLLFRVGQRFRNNLVVQALQQWKHVVADEKRTQVHQTTLMLQCWWRQLLAVRVVAGRRRIRLEIERRQRAFLLLLANKENKSACTITQLIRRRAMQLRQEKGQRQQQAVKRIQKFWRQQQAAWIALRHHIRRQQRLNAAVTVQRYLRGFLARRLLRLLKKIRRVEQWIVHRERQREVRAKERYRFGAVLVIQRAFRAWVRRRVAALRWRRAQFEREKRKIVKLQAYFRGRQDRASVAQHRRAFMRSILVIQCAWRCFAARLVKQRMVKKRLEEREAFAAESAERHRRMKARPINLPVTLNKVGWDGLVPKVSRADAKSRKTDTIANPKVVAAATRIQALWRGRKLRRRLKRERARERETTRRAVIRKRREAAICIQRHVRGIQGRNKAWRIIVNRAASNIQRAWRGFTTRRELFRMRAALKALMKMQLRWRLRRKQELQASRTRAARRIQRGWRRCMGKIWLYRAVRRQQFLAEEHAMGIALMKVTRKRVDDELLLQSFIHRDVQFLKNTEGLISIDDAEDIKSVQRTLYKVDSTKKQWKRRGYDGVWQELYRDVSGNSFEIDNSHFARFLKAMPRGFINQHSFPTQTVDLIFAKMKEPKSRSITFPRFNKAMGMVWQEKFAPNSKPSDLAESPTAVQKKQDQVHYLRFMNDFVLPSTLHNGKYRKLLDQSCTLRLEWAVKVLRRFANRIAGAERHHRFVVIYRQHKLEQARAHAAKVLQRHYRVYKFRSSLKATLAQMFIEYVDHRGRSVRFEHVETHRVISVANRRPAFLRGVKCNRMIPLPFPGEEFHAFCERHESAIDPYKKVPATLYCVECEDPMCTTCFARDHEKRAAFHLHEQKAIALCSHCHMETATRECLQCGDGKVPFCDVCFPFVHKREIQDINDNEYDVPARNLHRYRRLVVACVECDEKVAQWRCDVCEDEFCKRCMSKLHAKGQRQSHQCHRLSYFSVLKQEAQLKRQTEAQKAHDQKRKEREARRAEEERIQKLRASSATTIQAWTRSYQTRQKGKAYMKLVRQTIAAKAQRIKDDKKRASLGYKMRSVVGLEPGLKSDTLEEIEGRKRRIAAIKKTLFFYRNDDEEEVESKTDAGVARIGERSKEKRKRKKRWTKRARAAVEKAATTWLVYGMQVKITKGKEWKDNIGTVLSTQNLFTTGHVLVFIPLANRSVVVSWEDILPYDEDEILRQPYLSPVQAATDAAANFRAKFARFTDAASRRAKLLYLQSIEFHDVVQYAWVVEYNKFEKKEEYWNVVLNKRTFDVPKAIIALERLEGEERDRVDARVALAKKKLTQLLNPLQALDKPHLVSRRYAIVAISASLKTVETDVYARLRVEADALSCAKFWNDTVVSDPAFGGNKALRFLAACGAAPRSTKDCWNMMKLMQWIELRDSDAFTANAKAFFTKTQEVQSYIVGELAESIARNELKEAQENFDRLLRLKEETIQLLISKAEQEAATAEDRVK